MNLLPNILVVDDSLDNLFLIESILSDIKVNLIQALSGSEALKKTHGISLALAIIDVRMPEMSGQELALKMIEERFGEKVPIIFLTASNFDEIQVSNAYGLGAIDYIFKPINNFILKSKIMVFIDLFNQKQEIISNSVLLKKTAAELTRINVILIKSEEKYRSYIENAPDAVFVTDETGKYLEVNEAVCRITGYSKDELLKISIFKILSKDSFEEGRAQSLKLLKTGHSRGELLIKHKKGANRWVDLEGVRLSEKRFLGFAKDITQSKIWLEDIIDSERKFRAITENSPIGFYYSDVHGNFLYGNKKAEEIIGYEQDELIGKNFLNLKLLSPKDITKAIKLLALNILGKSTGPDNFTLNAKGGIQKQVEISTLVIKVKGENLIVGVVNDLTEKIKAQNQRRESELKFRTLFETMVHGVVHHDENGKIISSNPAAERILGLSSDQMLEHTTINSQLKFFNNDNTNFIRDAHPAMVALRTGKPVSNVIMEIFNPKIKEIRWINVNAVPLFKPRKRKPFQVHTTFEDITERRLAEEEYQTIIKTAIDGFCIMDASGRFLDVNNAYSNMTGYSKEELLNMSIQDVENKEDPEAIDRLIQRVLKTGSESCEIQHQCKNGKIADVQVSVIFKPIQGGRLYVFLHDITERNKVKKALQLSEQKYKTMLNASPDGIVLINLKGIIIEVSEIGLELFGIDNREELKGKDYLNFIPSEEKNIVREVIDKTIDEGIYQNIEIKLKKKNQSLFTGEISATLIQDPYGEPFLFMITVRDISQRKKMEEKMAHADRMASLGEMASGIAHELNQPLNTISFVMENVLYEVTRSKNVDKDYLKKKANKIFENILRTRNIIDHIMAFSRGNDDYILTGFNINSSINNAVGMITEQFKHYAISLNLQLDENLPLIIGNTYKFEQVILNLLLNSKDALLEKKSQNTVDYDMFIEVKSFKESESFIIEIIDNGTGIKEEDIDNVMLPFYTSKDTGKGTGLGLSISYRIIKEMGGIIELTRNIFNGVTFRIIFKISN